MKKFNCSTLFEMKNKTVYFWGKKEESKRSYYSRKDANKATRESILNSEGSTCYPSTTREL